MISGQLRDTPGSGWWLLGIIGGSQQFLVSSRNRGKERCYPGSIQRSLLKPKVERCFTSLKTAAGAHNPRGMDQFILRQILGSFSRVNVIKQTVHSPLFFREIVEIQRVLPSMAATLIFKYTEGGGRRGLQLQGKGDDKNRGTVIRFLPNRHSP